MKLSKFIYTIQHNIGISPKWERDLIKTDTHLKTYKLWMKGCECRYLAHQLYHNRLNYLKGWLR